MSNYKASIQLTLYGSDAVKFSPPCTLESAEATTFLNVFSKFILNKENFEQSYNKFDVLNSMEECIYNALLSTYDDFKDLLIIQISDLIEYKRDDVNYPIFYPMSLIEILDDIDEYRTTDFVVISI